MDEGGNRVERIEKEMRLHAGLQRIEADRVEAHRVDDVLEGQSNAAYASGAFIFAGTGTLLAQRFDDKSLRLSGEPVALAENVLLDVVLGRAVFSASESGTLVYQTVPPPY